MIASSHHRPGGPLNGWEPSGQGAHDLSWYGFIATAYQNDSAHGLRPNHLFHIHRHQIPEHHACWMEENFAQRNGWKFHRQSAACDNPAFYCFYKLWCQAVAIIESAGGRGYPNDWSAKHLARVTHRLGKGSPQVTGKL